MGSPRPSGASSTRSSGLRARRSLVPFLAACLLVAPAVAACSGSGSSPDTTASTSASASVRWQAPHAPVDEPMSQAESGQIDALANKALAASPDKSPGMIIGVWHPDKGFYIQAYGEAERGGTKLTRDTHMYIGSITKTATATAVLQLVDQGRLALDDTVEQVDPQLAAEHPEIADLTIKMLLAMASGLPDYANPPGKSLPKLLADPSTAFTADDLISDGLASGEVLPAGSGAYINTNYIILGEILAEVSGRPANEAINQVFADLGMANTKLEASGTAGLPAPASHGYYGALQAQEDQASGEAYGYDAGTDVSDWNISWAGAAGGAYSTIDDLAKWAAAGSGSTVLSQDLAELRQSTISVIDASVTEGAEGLGLFNRDGWIGHSGQLIGWEAEEKYNTANGAMWVALVNSTGGLTDAQQIRDTYFPELASFWPGADVALKTAEFIPAGVPRPSDTTTAPAGGDTASAPASQ
jgi:D-alanyl-D-alanine carboxypeptidase